MNSQDTLHEMAVQLAFVGPVRQRRSRRAELAGEIWIAQHFIGKRHASVFHLFGLGSGHQPGKVDGPFVSAGSVRTLDVAKLALKTEVDNLVDVRGFQFLGVDFGVLLVGAIAVDGVEKLRKTAAVTHAETAIRTDAENPFGLSAKVFSIVVTRVRWIVGRVYGQGGGSF